jgi:hypothetical protein
MATARDICTLTLKETGVVGVGQTPLAEDINDSFTLLKRMMGQWQKKRWLVNSLTEVVAIGNGAISRTVGPGGDFDTTVTPDKIQAAYFIQLNTGPNPVSFPLQDLFSYENYSRIQVKDLPTFPNFFFYDNKYPLGNIFIWPLPQSMYEIHLIVKSDLGFPVDLDSVMILPQEYEEAIHYNLAVRLGSLYKQPVAPATVALAKASLNTIRVANTQVPTLIMPPALRNGPSFNIFNADGY